MNPGWRVQQPYCVALAPQHKNQEPIWYIGCKVVDGSDKLFYTQTHFDMTYPDLSAWTKSIPAAPSTVFVVFGPGMTYFACAPGYGSIWSGIPIDLKDKVQKAFDTPCQVALGVKSAWFVMWPDGYYAWKFYGGYGELDKILDAAEPRSVEYLAISPYSPHQYFVAFRNRTVKYSLSPEWMPQMQQVFLEWQTEILRAAAQKPLPPHPSQYPYPSSPTPSYASTPQSQFAQLNNRTSIYQQAYGQTALSPQSPQSAGGGYFSTPTSPAPPYGYGMGTPVSPQSAGAYGAYPPYQSPQMLIVSPTGLPAQTSRDVSCMYPISSA
ncbi:hypothetical protein K432DRAFT_294944 [Lepidopterella palustris CBS 459.81]|uniref:Uncharacterized protein n=1 Tax=Lepidopterella palustris CBS 459.81 TaxID=1314670 RepID=A0A8E2EDA8_9PEZI|nr:hypothetical protein K432DRAFT_294944 [Lepidopterella palustris CBS 459.81]